MKEQCYISISERAPSIKAYLIGFAPKIITPGPCYKQEREFERNSVDGLVLLEDFSKGSIYQVPLNRIIVEDWSIREGEKNE